jgi:glutamate racemase
VPLAEENWTEEPETYLIAKKYLTKIIDFEPEALVLGCTHYPILRDVIQQTVGYNVTLIDSGEACAEEVKDLLIEKKLANPREITGERKLCDDLDHFYVTDAADRFARVATRFLGATPSKLEAIELFGVDKLEN